MRWVRFAIFVCVATLLQASVLDVIAVTALRIGPDLLLILLVFFAVYFNTTEAVIAAFTVGFAADLVVGVMGPKTISFGMFGTALAYLNRVIAVRQKPYQSLAIFAAGILAGLVGHILSLLKSQPVASNILARIFWTSLYSAAIGPFLFLPCAWWMRIKTHRFNR